MRYIAFYLAFKMNCHGSCSFGRTFESHAGDRSSIPGRDRPTFHYIAIDHLSDSGDLKNHRHEGYAKMRTISGNFTFQS